LTRFLEANYVPAYQQVAEFRRIVSKGLPDTKVGGNVVSYFCTPEGRVIHAAVGPVDPQVLYKEGKWAASRYAKIRHKDFETQRKLLAIAHRRLYGQTKMRDQKLSESGRKVSKFSHHGNSQVIDGDSLDTHVHRILAKKPLPLVGEVYQEIFEYLGQESVSARAVERLTEREKRTRRREAREKNQPPEIEVEEKRGEGEQVLPQDDDAESPEPESDESDASEADAKFANGDDAAEE